MEHKFNVSARSKLNSEERLKLLMPSKTLEMLGFTDGDILADVGCGTGIFSIPAAKISKSGRVYAIDISQDMLCDVLEQAETESIKNISAVKSEEYDLMLDDGTADLVLMCTVLHEIDDKERMLSEALRICTAGGKVAVIEFNETDLSAGPPLSHRLPRAKVKELMEMTGMVNIEEFDISAAFYVVTARPRHQPNSN